MTRIRTVVFPVAGRGTRFLPATKASPKEMLPIVDKPLIQYAVEEALEAGAEDLQDQGDQWQLTTDPSSLPDVRRALEEAGIPFASAEAGMVPSTTVALAADQAKTVLQLIDALDDLDDTQNVYANFDIPDEVLAQVG